MKSTFHIITLGCQMNHSDSARLSAFLKSNKYSEEKKAEIADLVIINTCGIRQSAENRAYSYVNTLRKKNKNAKIVVTGCLSKRSDVKKRLVSKVDLFMPISEMSDILLLLSGRKLKSELSLDEVRKMQGEKYLTILPDNSNSFSVYIPIGNGCNNFCSYCVVPYARGREVYRPAKDILREIKEAINNGAKEVTLIAQNVNSYKNNSYDFPKLLEKVAKIKGNFWIRFSSSHPKDVSSELIKIMGVYDKVCPHLHLALQSGDDNILKAMNRKYSATKFLSLVTKARKVDSEMAITTDVIVGFPGETIKNFKNTVKVFKKAEFDLAYISRYSPRPQTVAYLLEDDVSMIEKKKREKILEEIMFKTSYKKNLKYKNKEMTVLIEGKNRKGKYYGKTKNSKMVQIENNEKINTGIIGNFVLIKIKDAGIIGLSGDLVLCEKNRKYFI